MGSTTGAVCTVTTVTILPVGGLQPAADHRSRPTDADHAADHELVRRNEPRAARSAAQVSSTARRGGLPAVDSELGALATPPRCAHGDRRARRSCGMARPADRVGREPGRCGVAPPAGQAGRESPPSQQPSPLPPLAVRWSPGRRAAPGSTAVSYTHLRAHETDSYLVCRLLL